jgi:hypothetical protein
MARTDVRLASGLVLSVLLLAKVPAVHAQGKEKELDRKPTSCVLANAINRHRAADDKTIVFFMKGDKFFRNDLPKACPSLSPGETQIIYHYNTQSTKLTRLCASDTITSGTSQTRCPLGKFTPLTEEEAAQLTGTAGAAGAASNATGAKPAAAAPTSAAADDKEHAK